MTTPIFRMMQVFALAAFAFLCINLAIKLPRDMSLTINVQHNYPEFRGVATTYRSPDGSWGYNAPGYSYTEPRDVHKETVFGKDVFGEYIYQSPASAEESDEFVGPPEPGTHEPVQTLDRPE